MITERNVGLRGAVGARRRGLRGWVLLSCAMGVLVAMQAGIRVGGVAWAAGLTQGGSGSQQPDSKAPDSKSQGDSSAKPAAPAADADQPAFNPVPAEKDVEVATFYMRKGDVDAAIPRLEDAIKVKPDYAKPRMMLAQIYEKKGDAGDAAKYYREYLRVYPHAPDAKKVQEKIDKLSK